MKISVIVNAHYRKDYLERALASLSHQTIDPGLFEVIVVKNFEDEKIDSFSKTHGFTTILVEENTQVGFDLAEGIKNSTGDIITFLDDDDLYEPERLERMLRLFDNPEVFYVKNEVYFIDRAGKTLPGMRRLGINRNRLLGPEKLASRSAFLDRVKAGFNLSSIALRRKAMTPPYLKFLSENLVHSTDTFFFCVALSSGHSLYLDKEKLTGYRISNSASRQLGNDKEAFQKAITFYDNLIKTYSEFSLMFGPVAKNYLKVRICSQAIAREIKTLTGKMTTHKDFSIRPCLHLALKNRDLLLLYDILRCWKMKILAKAQ